MCVVLLRDRLIDWLGDWYVGYSMPRYTEADLAAQYYSDDCVNFEMYLL